MWPVLGLVFGKQPGPPTRASLSLAPPLPPCSLWPPAPTLRLALFQVPSLGHHWRTLPSY